MVIFYIFMLIVSLLVPMTMLFFGYRWKKKPPQKINKSYGYRTRRSMSSREAWAYAHKHCGATWVKLGWFTLFLTVVVMIVLPFITLEIVTVSIVGTIVVIMQLLPLVTSLVTTERVLKREFEI